MILRAVTVNVEAAHMDVDGRIHGHSYTVECWTASEVDLSQFQRDMRALAANIDHTKLESSVGDPSMEAMAKWFADRASLDRVVVRRPTLGCIVDYVRVGNAARL